MLSLSLNYELLNSTTILIEYYEFQEVSCADNSDFLCFLKSSLEKSVRPTFTLLRISFHLRNGFWLYAY